MPLVIPVLPTLPSTFTVPYSLPTGGTTWTPADATAFQTALDNSVGGDVIILSAGGVYESSFKLPIKSGSSWIYIISSALASLPAEGVRVSPSDVVNMPQIKPPHTTNRSAIYSYKSAHHYRFVGIEFLNDVTISNFNLITTGYGSGLYSDPGYTWSAVTADADLPSYITLDRCYIHNTNVYPIYCRCGFMMNGHYMASVECYYKNFVDAADSQAINIWNGGSHYKIVNNYLEASGENFMCGGTDPQVGNVVPTDIEFVGNYLYKDRAAWTISGTPRYAVKNLFELKIAERVLCDRNLMENCYRDDQGQTATAIVLTVRDQSNTNTNARVRDVTITYNRIHSCGAAWRLTGCDDIHPSLQNQRFLFEHNAWDDISESYAGSAKCGQISTVNPYPCLDLTFRHNLLLATGPIVQMLFLTAPTPPQYAVNGWLYENNIACHGDYGLYGNGQGTGNVALNHYVQGYDTGAPAFRKNVCITRPVDRDDTFWKTQPNVYGGPTSGNSMAIDVGAVGFTDYAGSDYTLTVGSTYHNWANDGTDPGPNWAVLGPAAARARSGAALAAPTITITSIDVTPVPVRTLEVVFSTSSVTGNVKMDLSYDNGATYTTVIASQPYYEGNLIYVVGTAVGSLCKVKITSLSAPAVFVESGTFSLGERYKARVGRQLVGMIT